MTLLANPLTYAHAAYTNQASQLHILIIIIIYYLLLHRKTSEPHRSA